MSETKRSLDAMVVLLRDALLTIITIASNTNAPDTAEIICRAQDALDGKWPFDSYEREVEDAKRSRAER